jgi:hypothetical protein
MSIDIPCKPHRSSPTKLSQSSSTNPCSPTLVFPISPHPSISRAQELGKSLETPGSQAALKKIEQICDTRTAQSVRDLISRTERSHMPDEALLVAVAKEVGLVDYEHARQQGGAIAEDADRALADDSYAHRWHAFADLCTALGLGQYELAAAKQRCGPAIDLCSS